MGSRLGKRRLAVFQKVRHAVNVVSSSVREQRKRRSRSPQWRATEKDFLAKFPSCAACGGTLRLNVHHIQPYHLFPELELEPTNLITLCMGPLECHLKIGHGGLFKAYVQSVVELARAAISLPAERESIEKKAYDTRQL